MTSDYSGVAVGAGFGGYSTVWVEGRTSNAAYLKEQAKWYKTTALSGGVYRTPFGTGYAYPPAQRNAMLGKAALLEAEAGNASAAAKLANIKALGSGTVLGAAFAAASEYADYRSGTDGGRAAVTAGVGFAASSITTYIAAGFVGGSIGGPPGAVAGAVAGAVVGVFTSGVAGSIYDKGLAWENLGDGWGAVKDAGAGVVDLAQWSGSKIEEGWSSLFD